MLELETLCSRAVTNSLPLEVRMHSASKIQRFFSLSQQEGRLSTPKAPATLFSLHLPRTSHCFWNQAHWGQLSSIIRGGGSWLFPTFPPNVSERDYNAVPSLAKELCLIWWRESVHMLCFQPGLNQKCPWYTLYTSTPTTCTPHWWSQYLFPAYQRQLQVSRWSFQQE